MMKTKLTFMIPLILMGISYTAIAQKTAKLIPEKSSITISGTSTLHDWEEQVQNFNVDLTVDFQDNKITRIDNVDLVCRSSSITSDYNLMTSKTLDALRAEQHPEITFDMISIEKLTVQDHNFSGVLTGNLSMAGVTRRIQVEFTGSNGGNIITIKGSKQIDMPDFNIEPPTAIMGTLKTGEIVVVSFNLKFLLS